MSTFYGVASTEEARAYLDHPILGRRLRDAARAALEAPVGLRAEEIFGSIDAMKLRSSMTLFHRVASDEPLFGAVLRRYFDGVEDEATLELLGEADRR